MLPTHDDIAKSIKEGTATPLEVFIYHQEPYFGDEFRMQLLEALKSYGNQRYNEALDKAIGQFPQSGVYYNDGEFCDLENEILNLKLKEDDTRIY